MIELNGVGKRFGDTVAVHPTSLTVAEGELVAIVGGSGSGKTTLLKMVNRLIEPTSGAISVAGADVSAGPAPDLRRRIGYCFQGVGLFPHLTVAANVGVTPQLLAWPPSRIRERVDHLLDLVELPAAQFGGRLPHQLSGGQQQRVGVARALAAQPPVVLFDEPFGALDPLTRDRLQQSLAAIRRQVTMTALFVTHDMTEAFLLADRVAVMQGGHLVQVGTPQALLHAPANAYVESLLAVPTQQAERVRALFAPASAEVLS